MLEDLFNQFEKAFDAVVSAGSGYLPGEWGARAADPPGNRDGVTLDNGRVLVNGVELPSLVIEQVRRAGFNPSWCNPSELEAAKRAAAVDCQVFDQPDGNDFYDGLELDAHEEKTLAEKYIPSPQNDIIARAMTFCERIKQERQRAGHPAAEPLYACSA